jgi:hypothetical protein
MTASREGARVGRFSRHPTADREERQIGEGKMSEIESPGYPPVFTLIDDPRDPENAQRLEDAERFRRDNPNGLLIHRRIIHPPNGKPNWKNVSTKERKRYLASLR